MNLSNRHALDADIRHCLADLIYLERLDHCGDELHAFIPACTA
jgi:hypothetical protein